MNASQTLDGLNGRPHIYNRSGAAVSLADVRAAIMRELRLVASVYSLEARSDAVSKVLADDRWLRSRSGQFLGATARDGFSAAFDHLPDVAR